MFKSSKIFFLISGFYKNDSIIYLFSKSLKFDSKNRVLFKFLVSTVFNFGNYNFYSFNSYYYFTISENIYSYLVYYKIGSYIRSSNFLKNYRKTFLILFLYLILNLMFDRHLSSK